MHWPGRETRRGKEECARLWAELAERSERVEFHDALANAEHGVLLQTLWSRRDGALVSTRLVLVTHFRGGKIAELWAYPSEEPALNAPAVLDKHAATIAAGML